MIRKIALLSAVSLMVACGGDAMPDASAPETPEAPSAEDAEGVADDEAGDDEAGDDEASDDEAGDDAE